MTTNPTPTPPEDPFAWLDRSDWLVAGAWAVAVVVALACIGGALGACLALAVTRG